MGPWLKFNLAYYAYPIDQSTTGAIGLIEWCQTYFQEKGVYSVSFDPGDAFKVTYQADPHSGIREINTYAALTADLVVAFLPAGVPSVGVPMEIDRAVSQGKIVVIFTDIIASWMLEYADTRVRQFSLDKDGVRGAADWLMSDAVTPGLVVDVPDPLPVQVAEGGRLPTRGHDDDAGLDLYVIERTPIPPNSFVDVPCGISVELPDWGWGLLTGRSSTLRVKGLLVHTAVIDAGYRGPLFAGAWNQTNQTVWVEAGERIAQLIVLPNLTRDLTPTRVDELNPSERGTGGFGSTGR